MDTFAKEELFFRDLAEVHLLLDFISGRGDKSLSGLKDVCEFDSAGDKVETLSPQQVIAEVCKELNQTQSLFPGSKLQLHYAIRDPS